MNLEYLREEIDKVDDELLMLFVKRMRLVSQVADYKNQHHIAVKNAEREAAILTRIQTNAEELGDEAAQLFHTLFELSRTYQDKLKQGDKQ